VFKRWVKLVITVWSVKRIGVKLVERQTTWRLQVGDTGKHFLDNERHSVVSNTWDYRRFDRIVFILPRGKGQKKTNSYKNVCLLNIYERKTI